MATLTFTTKGVSSFRRQELTLTKQTKSSPFQVSLVPHIWNFLSCDQSLTISELILLKDISMLVHVALVIRRLFSENSPIRVHQKCIKIQYLKQSKIFLRMLKNGVIKWTVKYRRNTF
jgi:hypothetical protein